jgi:ABC-type phosphate transport system substrate-binding protein
MISTRRQVLLSGVALATTWAWASTQKREAEAATAAFRLIVNETNPITSIDRKTLADVFLKKVTRWGDGAVIRPVDLRPESPVRIAFTDEVLRRTVVAVKSYWQQLVFSGREVPPPEVDSDEQVIKFVLRSPGAVGYVSGEVHLEHVKPISVK